MNLTASQLKELLEQSQALKMLQENKTLQKLLSIKDRLPLFEDLESLEIKSILYDVGFRQCSKGEYIITQGELSEEIYYILSGSCKVLQDEKPIAKLEAGAAFGEIGAIFDLERSASVVAASDRVTLLAFKIDQEEMEYNAAALAKIYKNLAYEITQKLYKQNSLQKL